MSCESPVLMIIFDCWVRSMCLYTGCLGCVYAPHIVILKIPLRYRVRKSTEHTTHYVRNKTNWKTTTTTTHRMHFSLPFAHGINKIIYSFIIIYSFSLYLSGLFFSFFLWLALASFFVLIWFLFHRSTRFHLMNQKPLSAPLLYV